MAANVDRQVHLGAIADKITCPGCLNFYRGSVYSCARGHTTCGLCNNEDARCPVENCGSRVDKLVWVAGLQGLSSRCEKKNKRAVVVQLMSDFVSL